MIREFGDINEWCWNEADGGQRYILGGGWNDALYSFVDAYAQPPFDRSVTNGFRCMTFLSPDTNSVVTDSPALRVSRDFFAEEPVPGADFEIYRRMYDYDKTELNPEIESIDESPDDWTIERVTFDAAYGQERMLALLFLPKKGKPPYQTVVYFPGSQVIQNRSTDLIRTVLFDYILKSSRALMFPIYKGTFERGTRLNSDIPEESNFYKEHVIWWAKDLSHSVDYLGTRADIDIGRLAYYGSSWGGRLGGIMTAVEKRFKASVLVVAGLSTRKTMPEVEELNFLPRVEVPTLMLNGKYDFYFPEKTAQKRFFELLGTPAQDKRWLLYEESHYVPRHHMIRETLDWLDKYLGPVERGLQSSK